MKLIPLTQGRNALVDDCNYERLNRFNWYAMKRNGIFCAARMGKDENGKRKVIYMHREIMTPQSGEEIDHIDGNECNNLKTNLRSATKTENGRGFRRKKMGASSQFRGVSFYRRDSLWMAYIQINKKKAHLGYFDYETDAARAYDKAALQYFGEFAQLNFPLTKVA